MDELDLGSPQAKTAHGKRDRHESEQAPTPPHPPAANDDDDGVAELFDDEQVRDIYYRNAEKLLALNEGSG